MTNLNITIYKCKKKTLQTSLSHDVSVNVIPRSNAFLLFKTVENSNYKNRRHSREAGMKLILKSKD